MSKEDTVERERQAVIRTGKTDRAVDWKIERYAWKIVDERGVTIDLEVKDLMVDLSYQRPSDSKQAERKILLIASEWSWFACGALRVGEYRGKYHVVDGKHRVLGARRRGDIETLPCVVFQVSGIPQEADAFIRSNTMRRGMTSVDKHRAKVVRGDEESKLIERLIEDAGRKPSTNSSSLTVRCIGMMERWIAADRDLFIRIWPIIVRICEGYPMHERIVGGICYIENQMHNHSGESLSNPRWSQRLKKIGYKDLLEACGRAAAYHARGGDKVFADGIVKAINHSLQESRKLILPE